MLPQMIPALPEVGAYRKKRATSVSRVSKDRCRGRRRSSSRLGKRSEEVCVLPKLQVLREKRVVYPDPLASVRDVPVLESTSKTFGILSQLRWDASRGKRNMQIEDAPAAPPKPQEVLAQAGQAAKNMAQRKARRRKEIKSDSKGFETTSDNFGKEGCKASEKFAEMRQFKAALIEELEQCASMRDVDGVHLAVATSVCGSSPGCSGGFVQLPASIRRQFLDVLNREAHKCRSQLESLQPEGEFQNLISSSTQDSRSVLTSIRTSIFAPKGATQGWSSESSKSSKDAPKLEGDLLNRQPSPVSRLTTFTSQTSAAEGIDELKLKSSPTRRTGISGAVMFQKFLTGSFKSEAEKAAAVVAQIELEQKAAAALPQQAAKAASWLAVRMRRSRRQEEVADIEEAADAEKAAEAEAATEQRRRQPRLKAATEPSVHRAEAQPAATKAGIEAETPKLAIETTGPSPRKTTPKLAIETRSSSKRRMSKRKAPSFKNNEADWIVLFRRMKDDNTVHQDELQNLLELLGFARPSQEWINQILPTVSKHTTLDEDQFVAFVSAFVKFQEKAYNAAFKEFDSDASGYLSQSEVADLVRSFAVEPMTHVLTELIEEVGDDQDGETVVDLPSFKLLMDLVKTREGFSKSEYDDMLEAYRRYDRDDSGEIDRREFTGILCWLGFACEQDFVNNMIRQVDVDDSGSISRREFLKCMRTIREDKVKALRLYMASSDTDGNGTIEEEEVETIFKELGYVADKDAIDDACRDAGILAAEWADGLDLSELWRLLEVYRQREGLSASECSDIEQAFEKYDKDGLGEITSLGVSSAIRWLGCLTCHEKLQNLVTFVDQDSSGQLDLPEFRKLVRMAYDKEMDQAAAVFDEYASDGLGKDDLDDDELFVTTSQARHMMRTLHCCGEDGEPLLDARYSFANVPHWDKSSFLMAVKRCKQTARLLFRERGGFSMDELLNLRDQFARFDKDKSGDIAKRELVLLIEEHFPDMAYSKEQRPSLQRLIEESDVDGSGAIDFQEYLLLMGHLREMQDRNRRVKEIKAVATSGFTKQEVDEFRELFLICDTDDDGSLTFVEVKVKINKVCPIGAKNEAELKLIFQSVLDAHRTEFPSQEAPENSVDFPEFLLLMSKLLALDFAQMNMRASSFSARPSA